MGRNRQQHDMRVSKYWLCVFLLLIIFFLCRTTLADSKHNVVIIASPSSSYQQGTATRIREKLETPEMEINIISADDIATFTHNKQTLYVAIGDYAINKLNEFDNDAFVLRLTSMKQPGTKYTSTRSDLITAQPACKHIQLIKSLNSTWTTVGVLASINTLDFSAELTKCAIRHNLNLQVYAIIDESDLLKTLETAVENNKVLLAIADPLIYNSHTVKNILLTAYRQRKPVIGYSDSFVHAGAVAAIYTSAETAGDDAARIIADFFSNNWQFEQQVYYSSGFSVSTNNQVATSLEITLPDIKRIRQSIKRIGENP